MPAGPQPLGFVYFAAAKYVGYSVFCKYTLQRKQDSLSEAQAVSPWVSGAARTAIGVVVGGLVGLSFWKIPFFARRDNLDQLLFFSLLVPVRIGEWWLLLRLFYKELLRHWKIASVLILFGILVSFALDFLGIVTACVLPGGMWVC